MVGQVPGYCLFPPPGFFGSRLSQPGVLVALVFSLAVPPLAEEGPAFVLADGSTLSRNVMVRKTSSLVSKAELHLVAPSGHPLKVLASSWRAGGGCLSKAGWCERCYNHFHRTLVLVSLA